MTPAAVSQHLRVMKEKGVLIERKEGKQVFYRLANSKIIEGYKMIREGIIEILNSRSKLFAREID